MFDWVRYFEKAKCFIRQINVTEIYKLLVIHKVQQMKSKVLPSLKRIPRRSTQTLAIPESVRTMITEIQKVVPLGQTPFQELDLKWRGQQDYDEIKYILQDILEFPSTDMADMHRDSNRLGSLDILENQDMLSKMLFEQGEPEIYCSCCGYLLQSQEIPLETSLRNIGNLGVSTHLYFQTLIFISILVSILFFVYGIFALATNVIAFNRFIQHEIIPTQTNFLTISLSAKQLNQTEQNKQFYFIQCWLGLAVVVIWFIAFVLAKYFQRNDEILIDNRTKSAADFSIVIQGVPTKMTQEQLQKELDTYYSQLSESQKPKQIDRPFKIAKINSAIPFYLTLDQFINTQLKNILQEKSSLRKQFVSWIIQRKTEETFSTPKNLRMEAYKKYRSLQNEIQNQYRSIVEQIVEKMKQKTHTQPTTSIFITFQSSYAKDLICHLNNPQDSVFALKEYVCSDDNTFFNIKYQDETFKTKIKQAPEPEDIIWTNIGQSLSKIVLRKLLTYSITAIILGGSFAIILLLSREQLKNNDDAFLSFLISLSITVINIIIQVVIRVLTNFEREVTQTNFQSALALKSIIAQVINSILLPFVVKYYIQQNLYKVDGLAFVVFSMGITNSFLLPALKLINLDHLVFLIKSFIYKKVLNKLGITQTELNSINTLSTFQVGNEYIYPVNLYLFVCFYASLQPIICIFGLAGLCFMYWVQKHALFTRSRRPFPGNDLVNRTMYRVMYFGPFIFSLGNLTWSNLIEGGGPKSAFIPNLISIGISAVFMLIPYKGFFNRLVKQNYGEEMHFEDNRIYLTSQYDRLNPATAKQAMTQYYKFLRQYREKIQNLSKEQVAKLQQILLTQKQKGNQDSLKLVKIFQQVIIQQAEKQQKQQIIKEQSSYQDHDHMSVEENHIIIKEDTIQELRVKKRRQVKNVVTAERLFKQFFLTEQNSLTFVQNWIDEAEGPTQNMLSLIPNDGLKLEKEKEQNSNVEIKVTAHQEGKKKQIKVPELHVNKMVIRKQMSYNTLKKLLAGYSKQVKGDHKPDSTSSQFPKVQNENKNQISNRNEESALKLTTQQENKNGFLAFMLKQGTVVPSETIGQ